MYRKALTEREFLDIKRITGIPRATVELTAQLSGRSVSMVKNIKKCADFSTYKEMTNGYLKRHQEKVAAAKAAKEAVDVIVPTETLQDSELSVNLNDYQEAVEKLARLKAENEVLGELIHISRILEEVNMSFTRIIGNSIAKSQE